MGFRSYVRKFFAAFFAPSPSFTAMVFPFPGAVFLRGLFSPKNSGTQVAQKSSFSMGFRSYVREFFAAFFAPSPSFTAMVFPCPGAVFLRGLFSPKNRVLKPDPSSSEIIIFYGFPLSPFFRGRRQGRQPLNSAPPAPHEWLALERPRATRALW